MDKNEILLLKARETASEKSPFEYKMGAIIVMGSQILSTGANRTSGNIPPLLFSSHRRSSKFGALHAEMDALINLFGRIWDLSPKADSRTKIYVSGLTKGGNIANSKPCKNCMKILWSFNIHRIYFSTYNGYKFLKLNKNNIHYLTNNKRCTSCDQSLENIY